MLKGLPQSERGPKWHKAHEKRLLKDKARRRARKGEREGFHFSKKRKSVSAEEAEAKYLRIKSKERKIHFLGKILLRLAGLKFVVWVREFLRKHLEPKYRG